MGATAGNDILSTTGEYQELHGFGGDDILSTNYLYTYLYGDNGADQLIAKVSADDIVLVVQDGGVGNDTLTADLTSSDQGVAVRQIGGAGNDVFDAYLHTTPSEYTRLYYLDNLIYGGHGDDNIRARAVLDRVEGTARNVIYGESGNDRIYASAEAGVNVYHAFSGLVSNTIDAGSGDDYVSAFIVGANTQSEVIFNSINGGAGNDEIHASMGTFGGESSQSARQDIWGGTGNDKIYVRSSGGTNNIHLSSDIMVDGGSGNDYISAESNKSYWDWDIFGGSILNHTLLGGDGRDEIHSSISSGWPGSFDTFIDGGSGSDVIEARVNLTEESGGYRGYISTIVEGGDGADIISAKVDMAPKYWGAAEGFYILNSISGGQGNDVLNADIALHISEDELWQDTFELQGNVLDGGTGNDVLTGTISVEGGPLSLNILASSSLYGGAGHDQLTVVGGKNNILDGGEGNDTLVGSVGDDTLIGGMGRDVLTGGLGADTFVFAEVDGAYWTDIVTDFESGVDVIQLSSDVFGALIAEANGQLLPDQLAYGTQAETAEQHLIYNTLTGALYYDQDGAGGVEQVKLASFSNYALLSENDFMLA